MSLRLLLGLLPGASDEDNQTTHEEVNFTNKGFENYVNIIVHYQTPAKFHIGMQVISLLLGIAYGGYTAYTCWTEKQAFLSYTRNLVIALVCRTFFSIIFDGAILLGSPFDVGGGNFLLSVERICLHLVIAFWLTMNIYLHERVQSNFNNEPALLLYQFAVPGIGVFFAFIWIFTLQDQWPINPWWIFLNPFTQWIANSINLLYLFIQLALLANIVRAMKKVTLDNDGVSLLRKVAAMMAILVFIFWLQFGLSIGLVPLHSSESYLYFFYFIDGLECAFICLVLYFFNKWVMEFLNRVSSIFLGSEESRTSGPNEILLNGNRGIVTIDSVFMTRESGRLKSIEDGESKDVVYSNVIEPERLKKTLDLYKRLNVIPTTQVTTVEGEEFYDCQLQSFLVPENSDSSKLSKRFGSLTSNASKSKVLFEDKNPKSVKMSAQKQKRNAFYSSKYLILDSKESDIPKYLETRPSVSSMSRKDSVKDERVKEDYFSELGATKDLVRKWLNDNSENMQKKESNRSAQPKLNQERKTKISNDGYFNSEILTPQLESTDNKPKENESQISPHKTFLSAINSVVSNVFFGYNTNGAKNLDEESAENIQKCSQQTYSGSLETDPSEKKTTNKNISNDAEKKLTIERSSVGTEMKPENEKPQNADKKDFKEKEQEILIPHRKDEKLQKRNQMFSENLIAKPKHSDENLNEVENQTNSETHDVLKSQSSISNSQIKNIPPSESKEGRTHLESSQSYKSKSESPEEEIKNNPSHLYGVSESKTEPVLKTDVKELEAEPDKFQNHSITYLDLLEFRSEREKLKTSEPTDIRKKSFDFSEAFSSTISFLISTGSNFFSNGKKILEFQKKEESVKQSLEVAPQQTEDEPHSENLEKLQNNTNEELKLKDGKPKPERTGPVSEPEKFIHRNNELNFKPQEYDNTRIHSSTDIRQIEPIPKIKVSNENEIQSVPDSQMKTLDFSNETILTDKNQDRHKADEFFTTLNGATINKMESHIPDHHSQGEISEYRQRIATATTAKESETSSESEFDVEKRDSISSAESFSVDQYYSQLMSLHEKFQNQSNSKYGEQKNRNRNQLN